MPEQRGHVGRVSVEAVCCVHTSPLHVCMYGAELVHLGVTACGTFIRGGRCIQRWVERSRHVQHGRRGDTYYIPTQSYHISRNDVQL